MEPTTTKSTSEAQPVTWTTAGIRTAVVSGAFTLAVLAMLIVNHFQAKSVTPLDNPQMIELKKQLAVNSNNDPLKKEIRALDLQLRQKHYRHIVIGNYGAWLLLGGMVVFLISIKPVTHRKKLPKPEKLDAAGYALENAQTRYAVVGFAVVTAGVLLAISNNNTTFIVPASAKAPNSTNSVPVAVDSGVKTVESAPGASKPAAAATFPTVADLKKNWPRFRGYSGSGISPFTNIPVAWNGPKGSNILWKADVALYSPSSPVIWGDHIFVTGANATKREVYCYDMSGKLLWTKEVDPKRSNNQPPNVMEDTGGFGPTTPCTDGQRVYVMYANGDVAAFDFAGTLVWARNVGPLENTYGHATSLEMYQNRLILQLDQATAKDGKSKILALDTATGQTVWETQPRPVPNSWATPIVINNGQRDLLIACGNPWVMGYDPANGQEIWRAKAMNGEVLPSPVYADGIVYTAIEGEKINAIKVDGSGDVTATHIAWSAEEGLPDIIGPLCDGQRVYLVNSSGTLTCYDAKAGKKLWDKDMEMTFKACTSLVGDKVYLVSDSGVGIVVQAASEFKELARSELGEEVLASPSFADGRMFLRSKKSIYCIGGK